MVATKINLTKLARTNAVRGCSYKIFLHKKINIQKFLYTKISRSTVQPVSKVNFNLILRYY